VGKYGMNTPEYSSVKRYFPMRGEIFFTTNGYIPISGIIRTQRPDRLHGPGKIQNWNNPPAPVIGLYFMFS
jgi:hypothetical protein